MQSGGLEAKLIGKLDTFRHEAQAANIEALIKLSTKAGVSGGAKRKAHVI